MLWAVPRAFVDTNVYVDAVKKGFWPDLKKALESRFGRFNIHPCPMVMVELLVGLEKSSDDGKWLSARGPIEALDEARGSVLAMPGRFVLGHVLGVDKPYPGFEPEQMGKWLRIAASAWRRASLSKRLDLGMLRSEMEQYKAMKIDRLNNARKGMIADGAESYDLSHETWARNLLKELDSNPTAESVAKTVAGTAAAYCAGRFLWDKADDASATPYNFAKHHTDMIDEQMMYYLSDPEMHFVTQDSRVRDKLEGLPAQDRVMLLGSLGF
jgi:hypothetical protein